MGMASRTEMAKEFHARAVLPAQGRMPGISDVIAHQRRGRAFRSRPRLGQASDEGKRGKLGGGVGKTAGQRGALAELAIHFKGEDEASLEDLALSRARALGERGQGGETRAELVFEIAFEAGDRRLEASAELSAIRGVAESTQGGF